ncbi:hypothetical protein BAOM_2976 [Peribacillus asahii]|uniref:DNA primase n=1 Tax=Peribacillus asahii TaxID=228899 RepID=A0A3T0KTK9_9BACI|nr:hypothetical protein [Peribacillus asahii]AZV43585.1 hypothetical protein BAOM_2976 [Peribacillus asahii]
MKLDKELIKNSLTVDEINKILLDLGSEEPKKDKEGNPIFTTVCHGGNSHKLYYYQDSKQFHCYSGCQESVDVYSLIAKVKKLTFPEDFPKTVQYVANLTGKRFGYSAANTIQSNKIDDWDWLSKFQRKDKPKVELNTYDDKVLEMFLKYPHEEWLDDGISAETMKKYEISYHVTQNKIVIPQRSITNELLGVRGRALNQEDVETGKKYMPLTIEGKTYSTMSFYSLYGLNHTQHAIKRIKKVIIFEDEKSVLKCEDYFGEDNFAVATYGSNLSDYQVNLLLSLGIEEVFIARDKEYEDPESEEAYRYSDKLLRQAMKFTPFVRTYILFDKWDLLGYKCSPADRGKEVLLELMKNKYEVTTVEEECI